MKLKYKIFFIFIIALFFLGGITAVVPGNRTFSANENRYLTQFPKISLSGILSGEVQEDMTNAVNDQFRWRDGWIRMSTRVKKAMGYQDIGGVYLGKEHYYFAKVMNQDISQTNYFQNLRFVNFLAKQQTEAEVTVMLVPSPGTILTDYLPKYATLYDSDKMYQEASELLEGVSVVDLRTALKQESEERQIYYKTDHHWNLRGAYVGYQDYCQSRGRQARDYDSFGIKAVSDSFYGTLYSKILDPAAVPDELAAPTNLPELDVVCDKKTHDGIYDSSKLKEKDKYAYFFGGNYGEVDIKNDQAETEGKLLVIKDSFANSMIPFMVEDYSEIKLLDMRYYKKSVKEALEEYQPDEVLVLYEMSNFAQDHNLSQLIK